MIQNISNPQSVMQALAPHIDEFVRFEYIYGPWNALARDDLDTLTRVQIRNGNSLIISASHSVGWNGGSANDLKSLKFIINPP